MTFPDQNKALPWVWDHFGESGGMLPLKIFKVRILNVAEIEFQTTKFPDFSLTFGILLEVSFKFPDFSRFSRSVATL